MPNIVVRRRSTVAAGLVDTEVVTSNEGFEEVLRSMLTKAQAERGHSNWSDADPEVWIESDLVGRLAVGDDIEALVQRTIGQVRSRIRPLPKYPLTMQSLNNLPRRSELEVTGVYMLYRPCVGTDSPLSVQEGSTCLIAAPTHGQTLGDALEAEANRAPATGAMSFSYIPTGLDDVTDEVHRQCYARLHPLLGEAPRRQT